MSSHPSHDAAAPTSGATSEAVPRPAGAASDRPATAATREDGVAPRAEEPPAALAESGPTGRAPYQRTDERPAHLRSWGLPPEWEWGHEGVWIGRDRHAQLVIDPLGRRQSLITTPTQEFHPWLRAEAQALDERRHRCIPTTYAYWPRDEHVPRGPGYIRHWIEGETLLARTMRMGPVDLRAAVSLLRALGTCLVGLHESQQPHGAIAPSTVWENPTGETFLLGWQWALPATDRPAALKPDADWVAIAPEWERAGAAAACYEWRPTAASDQWQLAALVVSALAGEPILGGPVPPLRLLRSDIPHSVARILEQALAQDPAERHPSVAVLLKMLDRAIGEAPTLITGEVPAGSQMSLGLLPRESVGLARSLQLGSQALRPLDGTPRALGARSLASMPAHPAGDGDGEGTTLPAVGHQGPAGTPTDRASGRCTVTPAKTRCGRAPGRGAGREGGAVVTEEVERQLRAATGLDYELLGRLGGGSYGEVWRARDLTLEREVAVKGLHAWIAADAASLERFRREAKIVAALQHPRILPVHDFNERGGVAYLVMALAEHGSLTDRLARLGPRPLAEVAPEVAPLLDGLHAAHEAGVVHRDLKPDNILIDRHARWLIGDFGIAAAPGDEPRGTTGTPSFAAPEQLLGEPQDPRVDLYAIAAIVYFALTGEPPFRGSTPAALVSAQLRGVITGPAAFRTAPAAVREWVLRGLAPNPAERWPSAVAMKEAWRTATAPHATAAHPAPLGVRSFVPPVLASLFDRLARARQAGES